MSAATDAFTAANDRLIEVFAPDPLTINGTDYTGIPDETRREEKIEESGFLEHIDLSYLLSRSVLTATPEIGTPCTYQGRAYRLASTRVDEVSFTLLLREIA